MDSNKKQNSVRYNYQVRDINKKACLTRLQPDICFVTKVARGSRCSRRSPFMQLSRQLCRCYASAKTQMQVKRVLNGRCASVQRAAEHPPVVRRTAPSNRRIKLTAKLKSLSAFSLLAAYPPPVRYTPSAGEEIY